MREFRNNDVVRSFTPMPSGAKAHLDQSLSDEQFECLVNSVLLNLLQGSPLLGGPGGPKNSKTFRC
jgi:hypothetical protein